jgi:hypothetical protein
MVEGRESQEGKLFDLRNRTSELAVFGSPALIL